MRSLLWLLLFAAPAFGSTPAIRVPEVVEEQPAPVPPAPPTPIAVPKLTPELLYVIDSDAECVVTASPLGVVNIVGEAGPLRLRGKFIESPNKIQTKNFAGKYLFTVEPVGKGRVEILIIPVGAKSEKDIIRRTIDVDDGTAPQPPPKPIDPPTPDVPAPIAGDGFKVLIVYEAMQAQQLPAGQQSAIFGKATRDYLNAKSPLGPDGKTREWRIYDADVDTSNETKTWQDAMKRPRTSIPWIIVSDGKSGFEGPLPATLTEIETLLKKYGK